MLMQNANSTKSTQRTANALFSKSEIDSLSVEDIRALLYHSQNLQLKLRIQNDRFRQATKEAQQARLSRMNQLKRFVHELRNALNVINGVTSILSMEEGLNATQRQFPPMLRSTSKILMDLINVTLDDEKVAISLESAEDDPPLRHISEGEKKAARKVLIVEDDSSNVLVVSLFLENLGYKYDVARDGRECLEKIQKYSYDLILMDLSMPDIDGLAAVRQIRHMEEQGWTQSAQIIAMTARALIEDREKCIAAGMNDYISKPFSQNQLRRKLEENIRPPEKAIIQHTK